MKLKRGRGAMIAVFIIAIVVFGGIYTAWNTVTDVFLPPSTSQTRQVPLVVQNGETADQVANDLYAKGLIRNPLAFRIWARIKGLDTSLEAGAYNLTPNMTIDQIIARLQNGQPDEKRLAVIDGFRIEQIAANAKGAGLPNFNEQDFLNYTHHPDQFPDAAKFQTLLKGAPNMEGLLFPDTYLIPVNYNTVQVIDLMLNEMQQAIQQNNLVAKAQQHQLSEYQMIILASVVQREASNVGQMGLIAGIYWNRVETQNPETVGTMGSDPTVEYAIDTDQPPPTKDRPHYWVNLGDYGTGKTVDTDSLWNTYTHAGFPPSPISSPNLAALKAAASPTSTKCYFFFTNPKDGSLVCDATQAQFNQDIAKYGIH
jgi:UPF0755 protein